MKKIPTDWTNLTMETPGIEIHNWRLTLIGIVLSTSKYFFFEGYSKTNINVPLFACSSNY